MPKNLLAASNVHVLDTWLRRQPSFVFDYDGTLAPMFRRPHGAVMRKRTQQLLSRLASVAPCAILTGRPVHDAKVLLGDLPYRVIVGNHGAEWSTGHSHAARLSARLRKQVVAWGAGQPGVVIEDKNGFGMSIHWREVPQARWRDVASFAASLNDIELVPGHRVFNILPSGAPNKGTAVLKLRQHLQRSQVIFVGDDVTDEYAFRLRAKSWLLCIRVGQLRGSAAPWFIRQQSDIDALLTRMAVHVEAQSGFPVRSRS